MKLYHKATNIILVFLFLNVFISSITVSEVKTFNPQSKTIIKSIKIIIDDPEHLVSKGYITFIGRLALNGTGCGVGTPNKLMNNEVLNLPMNNYYNVGFQAYKRTELGKIDKTQSMYNKTIYLSAKVKTIKIYLKKDSDNDWVLMMLDKSQQVLAKISF